MRISEGSEVSEVFLDLLKNNDEKGIAIFQKNFSVKIKSLKKALL